MSRVKGRPFIFAEGKQLEEYGVAKFPSELRGPVAQSKKHWSQL